MGRRVYDIKESIYADGPVQPQQAEMTVEIGSCGYYHIQDTPSSIYDYDTNSSVTPCVCMSPISVLLYTVSCCGFPAVFCCSVF